jgi:outer membrane protein TolC
LFTGSAARSEITEASVESQRLRLNVQTARGRIAMETADAFRQAQDAEEYHQVVALDLELARENVSVVLARANEGKASLEELEAARTEESRKWTEYYRSRASAELAAYEILHKTGRLIALFR